MVLEETECIIQCRFCKTCNIIHTQPYPCYYIEPRLKIPAKLQITYVPYWRFKGIEFSLGKKWPGFKVIDQSYLAVDDKSLPVSMGLRSQTQKLKFVRKGIEGSFLPPAVSRKDILKQIAGGSEKKIHIGEILSLIFMPFYQDKGICYDGLSGKVTSTEVSGFISNGKSLPYHLEFTPSLCPDCGWDLEGETDSLVLCCKNCLCFWLIHQKTLKKIKVKCYGTPEDAEMLLPFWRFEIEFQILNCSTYAQLIKMANIPKVVREEHRKQPVYFFTPAFKINPKLFLRIGRQITLAQIVPTRIGALSKCRFHPVGLQLEEGFQAVVPIVMDLCTNKEETVKILIKERLKLTSFSLAYIPFRSSGSEYIQDSLGISLPKNSIKFGRQL
ncbi:MAG: hypothetical protein KKE44_25355 [Proteobacteria bacterium]|nr:hypothetical protein [Pseudomonadota bacterium]MBU1586060.1 hypothetical protein [Pseudomonadota bacterium]MBU2455642.1 hypothetical protein [Pseudomonadota bacterium]MBU2629758.1 hypothetical protein [Pseudomonadota bacterium]